MVLPSPRRCLAAGAVLLVLGGCGPSIDSPAATEGEATDTEEDNTDPYVDPPSSEATYGVPVTDSDWWGTGSSSSSSSGDLPGSESTSREPDTDTDTDTDTDSDSDTDTDTDTDGASSDSG